jgi:two-component system sensor histidine kinase PilS (NtrC family)
MDQKTLKTVKGLMLCRIIILTLLLSIAFLFQLSEKRLFFIPLTNSFYYFISLFYLVTIIYGLFLKKTRSLKKFAFIQFVLDHLFIIGLIYFTGGEESFFPITYIFSIIGSSILFYKRGAFLSASFATLLYGLLLVFQLYQWIAPPGQSSASALETGQTFYSLVIYMAAFYIVAFLSSTISEELKRKKKELIQKQADYHQLETFNQNIIQSLDSGLLTIDLSGRIIFLNRTGEKILNRNERELKETSIYGLFSKIDEVIERIRKKPSESFSNYQRYETLLTDQDGRKIYLGFSISPLTDTEGSSIGYTLIFQDITKYKEMEEQMKRVDKMAAVGVLAAGMAHEIRNPLASLSGSIQMLKSELTLNDYQQHLMEITLRESERLNALITDFLLFAHPPQIHKTFYPLRRIIQETLDLFIHSPYFHDGIRIFRPNGHEEIQAFVDPDQMKQVFWNLIINSAQALFDGGEIRIQLGKGNARDEISLLDSSTLKEKEWIKISVIDTGNGIAPQEKDKIFEPFFTTKENGTGLGLSIVHKIIESHNGLIKVESESGKGATFTVFLPAN